MSDKDIVRIYNMGYRAGHHDTVEACYVDIVSADMDTYHEDVVADIMAEHKAENAELLELEKLSAFVEAELDTINDTICDECIHKLLNKSGYSDADLEAFVARIKRTVLEGLELQAVRRRRDDKPRDTI